MTAAIDRRRIVLGAGLVLMVTGIGFEGLAVPTILSAALDELRGLPLYGWAFSGFWLANLVGITLAGHESDRRGPLLPFVAGVTAFTAGLVVAGLAPDMAWVVAGRLVQGLGAGAIGAVTYVAIARGFPPDVQPRMIAVISSAWVVPGLVGPALAGWVSQELSWRWAFLGLAPMLPLAAVAVAVPLGRLATPPASRAAGRRPQSAVGTAILLAAGIGGLLTALTWLHPVGSPVLGLVGAIVALRALRRLLPAGAMTGATPRGAAIAALALLSAAFLGVEAFVPLAVASVRDAGTVAGGLALTAAALTWAGGAWILARLARRGMQRRLARVGIGLVGVGILVEATVPLFAPAPVGVAAAGWAIAGLGMGLAYSTLTLATIQAAPPGEEGMTSSAHQLATVIGTALGTGLAGAVVTLSAAGPLGLAPGLALADLLLLLALFPAFAVARRISLPASGEREVALPIAPHGQP